MINFNDMFLFSKAVEHNGISGAAQALGIERSKISRRIAELEVRIGTRLIQRSTRHFAVTELGKAFNKYCLNMIAEANAGFNEIACAIDRPSGIVRISCTTILAQHILSPLIPIFLKDQPDIRLAIDTVKREVNIEDNFDIFFRVMTIPCQDSSLIVRSLGIYQPMLVASPSLLDRCGRPTTLDELANLPTISYSLPQGPHTWTLISPEKKEVHYRHDPILIIDDFVVSRQVAMHGIGVALLPLSLCKEDVCSGALEIILPDYSFPLTELQIVLPSRQGILPAVRSFIDF